MNKLILPALGEGIESAVVACWHVSVGEEVSSDQDVVEVVTDKASFNVPTPTGGIIKEILIQAGTKVTVGESLATFELLVD